MAPIRIRRAIGLVMDKTSISIAKASGNADGHLEALVVKATSHDSGAVPGEKHLQEIVARTWSSKPRAYSCVKSISKRLQKTRDWVVAIKALILVHRLAIEGGKAIREEIAYASFGRFDRLLDLSGFEDQSHYDSWDYSDFVRSYGVYLGEKVRFTAAEEEEEQFNEDAETVFRKVRKLQGLLDLVLRCRPRGMARLNRIVIAALYLVVVDSFNIYGDLCERLSSVLVVFPEIGVENSAVALQLYVKAASQIDGLFEYYGACRDVGIGNSVGYPEVHRISDDLLKSLEEFLKLKLSARSETEIPGPNSSGKTSILMLPPPAMEELIDLEEDGNEMALTIFSEPESPASDHRVSEGKGEEDWELELVESARDLARQRAELGGGFEDPFVASLAVQPPFYVQMADMESKQKLLVQEQQLWRQYGRTVGVSESVMVNQNSNGQPRAFYY